MSLRTRALSFVAFTALVLAGCGSFPNSGSSISGHPRFETTSCPFSTGGENFSQSQVRCGYLIVPENRRIDRGRTIQVAVAIFKSPLRNPAPDPLVYLVGGPGGQLIGPMAPSIVADGLPNYVGNRDLILVDQRGVGYSRPSLACTPKETGQQCRARLVKEGIDLAAYNTVENAADIADLGPALGYKQVNLYGNSYGTTLALQVMRDHPQGIRSVVMDGITGPTFNAYNDFNTSIWHAVQQVFKDCAASSNCNAEYPHLQQTFTRLLAHLQAHPAHPRIYSPELQREATGTVRGVDVWVALREVLGNPRDVSSVPPLITTLAGGDFSVAAQYVRSTAARPYPDSAGMALSMECSGEQSGASPATIAAHSQMVPASIRSAAIAYEVDALKGCTIWHVPSIGPENHTYFRSPIPTLLLPGKYDPKTPPTLAQALAPKLGHAFLVVMPTSSHAVVGTDVCPDGIAADFLAHPNRKPDTSCTAQMTMIWL